MCSTASSSEPAITGCEQLGLASCPAPPDRPDGMNDVPRLHPVTGGDPGVTDLATAKTLADLEQLRPGRIVNRPVDSAAAQKCLIGRIDDSLDVERDDVAVDGPQSGAHRSLRMWVGRRGQRPTAAMAAPQHIAVRCQDSTMTCHAQGATRRSPAGRSSESREGGRACSLRRMVPRPIAEYGASRNRSPDRTVLCNADRSLPRGKAPSSG